MKRLMSRSHGANGSIIVMPAPFCRGLIDGRGCRSGARAVKARGAPADEALPARPTRAT
jgi:hypothetical protein